MRTFKYSDWTTWLLQVWFSCVPSLRKSCVLYSFPLLYRLWDLSWHSYNLWRAQRIIKEFSKLYFDIWKCIPYALKHWQVEIWQFSLKTRDSQKINTWVQNILFYSLISELNSKIVWNETVQEEHRKGSLKHRRMPGYGGAVGQPSGTNDSPSCKTKKQLTNFYSICLNWAAGRSLCEHSIRNPHKKLLHKYSCLLLGTVGKASLAAPAVSLLSAEKRR